MTENNKLAESLERLTPDDIAPLTEIDIMKRRRAVRRELTRRFFMAVCVIAALLSVNHMIRTFVEYRKSTEFYTELDNAEAGDIMKNSRALSASPESFPVLSFSAAYTANGRQSISDDVQRTLLKVRSLKLSNPDIYGWITVDGTNISYPILQSTDNDHYLHHEYLGGYLKAGSIFVDYRCDKSIMKNHNTVIYGHNMQNGLMFSPLISFMSKDFFDENKFVYICTPEGYYTYEIFAVYKANYLSNFNRTGFESHEAFVEYANKMRGLSLFEREGIDFDTDSRMITLSTCTNVIWSERYSVQALLVNAFEFSGA
ncbi:MAG: class B sortase [Clostridia bacterium]|nr:class B sortase [Clostridia bacterium]